MAYDLSILAWGKEHLGLCLASFLNICHTILLIFPLDFNCFTARLKIRNWVSSTSHPISIFSLPSPVKTKNWVGDTAQGWHIFKTPSMDFVGVSCCVLHQANAHPWILHGGSKPLWQMKGGKKRMTLNCKSRICSEFFGRNFFLQIFKV